MTLLVALQGDMNVYFALDFTPSASVELTCFTLY